MKNKIIFIIMTIMSLSFTNELFSKEKEKGIKSMTKEEQIKIAQSAAPPHISKDATVMVMGEDGKLVEAKKGTNGFTCIPDIDGQEVPDPMCADEAAYQWANDLMSNQPKPTNTIPGIAYMAMGGWHWEKDGKMTLSAQKESDAKRIKEPPHWMVLWPFDSKGGIPITHNNKFGTYIMFEGTPYAHLMIYQDPNKIK